MIKTNYYNLSAGKVLEKLKSNASGLLIKEAERRLEKYGLNQLLEEKKVSWLIILLSQFKSPLVYILVAAVLISFVLGDFIDGYVIIGAIVINVIVGFIQENKAQGALSALKKVITLQARVIRDGQKRLIKATEVVPGDIFFLEAGDKVNADARLITTNDLKANEASLTGESSPVLKNTEVLKGEVSLGDRKNSIFMGTVIIQGTGLAVVTRTGLETELGKIASLVHETKEEPTPLQKKLSSFSRKLGLIILAICVAILFIGLISGRDFIEMFTVSVAVAVAAIPEGLLVAMTIILALGMQRILKKQGLVRKLVAAETLGSTTVICTDKTGTLTEGEMRVDKFITKHHELNLKSKSLVPKIGRAESHELMLALRIGMLNNDAYIVNPEAELEKWKVYGNLTERALLIAGAQIGLVKEELEKETPRLATMPFDSTKKYMVTLHEFKAKENIIYLKGAPEKVIAMSNFIKSGETHERLSQSDRQKIIRKYEVMSRKGLRMLALGYKRISVNEKNLKKMCDPCQDFTFVGLVGIKDPLRPEAKETIKTCQNAGIRTVMVTGDHKLTAMAIANEIGLGVKDKNILEGKDLDKISDNDLTKRVKDITVYARVSPKDKIRIVDAWQARGEVVAMTGDGVNDAPALKSADIGVALGSGTDVAKETADLVILDNNFKTIVAAVRQGRVIFDNIKKVALYLLSDSFSEVLLISGSLFFGLPLPLLAAQILWINLVTDGFPNIALANEPIEEEVMEGRPAPKDAPLLNKEMNFLIFLISLITGIGNLLLFYFIWKLTGDIERSRTIVFVALGLDSLLYVFSIRSLRHSIFTGGLFHNKYLILAVLAGLSLQLVAIYIPFLQNILRTVALGLIDWLIILVVCLLVITFIEISKHIFLVRQRRVS